MQDLLSTFHWEPVALALIPLVMAIAVVVYERMHGTSASRSPASPSSQTGTTL